MARIVVVEDNRESADLTQREADPSAIDLIVLDGILPEISHPHRREPFVAQDAQNPPIVAARLTPWSPDC